MQTAPQILIPTLTLFLTEINQQKVTGKAIITLILSQNLLKILILSQIQNQRIQKMVQR